VLNYLPFLGAIAGTVGVGMVALVTFDTVGQAMLAPLAYYTLTSLEGQIVTPLLLGRHLAINTVAVFVTVMLWVWLWGIAGAFLAVPVLVMVKVLSDNLPPLAPSGGSSKRARATRPQAGTGGGLPSAGLAARPRGAAYFSRMKQDAQSRKGAPARRRRSAFSASHHQKSVPRS
jgi:hypothetical protein